MTDGPEDPWAGRRPPAGAAPQEVADLLRTFSGAPSRRRRAPRPDAPTTIVPLLAAPEQTDLDPSRIDEARSRLKAQAAAAANAAAEAAATPSPVDPASFDAARTRLRGTRGRRR